MCGIAGILSQSQDPEARHRLGRMMRLLRHRGPDDQGMWETGGVLLGHQRLSIIDLASGHQPMTNQDKSLALVFNGEIYNYRDLRKKLSQEGYGFRTQSDTEVLLALYERRGTSCLDALRGMFAFAIWDEKKQFLFCARDRFGQKPFFYHVHKGGFVFASEMAALLAEGNIPKKINHQALYHYFRYGYVPQPLSIYRDIAKLPPAHYLIWNHKGIKLEPYWRLRAPEKSAMPEEKTLIAQGMSLFEESVKLRLVSDVPVGSFLSGGLDSSAITQVMTRSASNKVKSFSVGFHESLYDESKEAQAVADHVGTEHHRLQVTPDAASVLPLLARHFGEPFADSSCLPAYYLAKAASGQIKVALSGDGADELFLGYDRYRALAQSERWHDLLRFIPGPVMAGIAQCFSGGLDQREKAVRVRRFLSALPLEQKARYLQWVGLYSDAELKQVLAPEIVREAREDLLARGFDQQRPEWDPMRHASALDLEYYLPGDLLPKVDITSMANSLEVRNPFLDHKLAEFIWAVPSDVKIKGLGAKSLLKKMFQEKLPAMTLLRPKTGFGVPVRQWLAGQLQSFVADRLFSSGAGVAEIADMSRVRPLWEAHVSGRENHEKQLWPLVMYELWHEEIHKQKTLVSA